jgi:pyruvate/oxaloacetate carboxyltransferase
MEPNTLISDISTQLVLALVPVVVGALAFIGKEIYQWLKSKVTVEHMIILEQLAGGAVSAVEQTLKQSPSKEKLSAALAICRQALLKRGIQLDEQQIVAAIEAEIYARKVGVQAQP